MSAPQLDLLPVSPTRLMPPEVFVPTSNIFFSKMVPLVQQLNGALTWLNARATETEQNTDAATAAAATALASANHKGNWAALAGALAVPATVNHAGKIWILTANLADVTAAEPGVHAAWTALVAVGVTRFRVIETAVSISAAARDFIVMTAAGQTVTLPPEPSGGDEVGGSVGNFKDTLLDPGANTINGVAGQRQIKIPNSTWGLIWAGGTWRRI